jgi:hypothetical protein
MTTWKGFDGKRSRTGWWHYPGLMTKQLQSLDTRCSGRGANRWPPKWIAVLAVRRFVVVAAQSEGLIAQNRFRPPRRLVCELNVGKSGASVFLVNYHSTSVPCSVVCYHSGVGLSSTKTQIIPTINDIWRANWSQKNSFVFPVFHFFVPPIKNL